MYGNVDAFALALEEQPWLKKIVDAAGIPREGRAIAEGPLLGRPGAGAVQGRAPKNPIRFLGRMKRRLARL
jgi:hypothetical protein